MSKKNALIPVSDDIRNLVETEAKALCDDIRKENPTFKNESFNQDCAAMTAWRCGLIVKHDETKSLQIFKVCSNASALRQAIEADAVKAEVVSKIARSLLTPSTQATPPKK